MANYLTGQDILTDVLSRSDELAIGSSDRETEAKRYIQAAYIGIIGEGFPWPWAKKRPPGVLLTYTPVTAGTAQVTNQSATVTLSSAPSSSVAGWKFFADLHGIVCRVLSHTGGSPTLTLDAVYVGVSASGLAYHLVQDEYALASDFLRPFQKPFLRDMHGCCHCDLIHEDELAFRFQYPANLGTPEYVCLIGPQTIRLGPVPDSGKRYEYAYLRHPGVLDFSGGAGDTLIIDPAEDRIVVSFFALANLLTDKSDDRAAVFAQAGQAKLTQMKLLAHKLNKPRAWVRRGNNVATRR